MIEIQNIVKHSECPLCYSTKINKIGAIQYQNPLFFSTCNITLSTIPELWKCNNCLSNFVQNIIPEKLAYELYSKSSAEQRWSQELFKTSKSDNLINELLKKFKQGTTILDIGCNTGLLLDFAKSCGCITSGIELSEASKKILQEKGHQIFDSFDSIDDESLDIITAFDLVEHLYDVPNFLIKSLSKLKKNGNLIILTGDSNSISFNITKANWWYIRYPEHIVFPSKKYFIENSDFSLESYIPTYASRGYETPYYKMLYSFVKSFFTGNYNGLPSLGPDHQLLVLKK